MSPQPNYTKFTTLRGKAPCGVSWSKDADGTCNWCQWPKRDHIVYQDYMSDLQNKLAEMSEQLAHYIAGCTCAQRPYCFMHTWAFHQENCAPHDHYSILAPEEQLQKRLDTITQIIEDADRRCEAVDGPVAKIQQELTDAEWRKIYVAAVGHE